MAESVPPTPRLASVIIPQLQPLAFTSFCISSLLHHTRHPWELIVVDHGSAAETTAYLQGIKEAASVRVEVLTSPQWGCLAAACNQAIRAARGQVLVLMSSATIVTDAWLDQLGALAESNASLGMVGPMANAVAPPQRLDPVPYTNLDEMHAFATRWRSEHRGQWFETDQLSGRCALIKRSVLDHIGALEERPGISFGEHLSHQVRQAGYALAVAHDLFVHCGAEETAATPAGSTTKIEVLGAADFARRFGVPDTARALCGYTTTADTHAVLALLAHARPRRVLEIGTALGHMTANLTEWTADDARIFTLGIVRGMDPGGAPEQGVEAPDRGDFGRLAGQFGKAHKLFFITADSRRYDFQRLAPLDFAFIDGGHDLELATSDTRRAYEALAPGGWLVWHDFDSTVPWVHVREAIEHLQLPETVYHVAGTEVAFLQKRPPLASTATEVRPSALRVVWEGDQRGLHSLALVNRALWRGLIERGHDLGLQSDGPVPTPDLLPPDPLLEARIGCGPSGGPVQVHVTHRWPPRLDPPPQGRWVFMQPWEFGSLPRAWLPALERVDEVWAYSHSVRDCYVDAGVPAERVHIVPLGVDPAIFRPGRAPHPLPPGPEFRFLFVGGTIHRKGIDLLLTAFARAFTPADGVSLVIKDMGTRSFYRGQTAETSVARLRSAGHTVDYIETALAPDELASLYAACDALVHPYRGEGFALPVVEAMACGLPVIVTGAGPALDYADDTTAYLVPARRTELPECRVGEFATVGRPWLWEPDLDALIELLRHIASNRDAARAKGAAASARIRTQFTWARSADVVEARLRALVQGRARERISPQVKPSTAVGGPVVGCGQRRAARPERSLAALPNGPRAPVSLTMIVRNEEANLPACLESASGLFDEIVVVDTGSTDRTVEIAALFGARVFDFVWVDDFAAARNAALARATGHYIFWLDADDRIEPPERGKLKGLLAGLGRDGNEAAYVVRCSCDPDSRGGGATVVDHIRLFPNREEVRWTYRVHEQILPSLRQAGIEVRWTDVTVRHVGYNDPDLRARKLVRDSRILEAELDERPEDPFVLFNLGSIAIERQDGQAALGYLRRSLNGSAPTDSITRKLYALIARAHQILKDPAAALQVCAEGRAVFPEDAELLFREAVLRRQGGDRAGAEACWRKILTLKRPDQFSSVDMGIYGQLTRRNLAVLAEERGDRTEAAILWANVLAECPGDREATEAHARLTGSAALANAAHPSTEARP